MPLSVQILTTEGQKTPRGNIKNQNAKLKMKEAVAASRDSAILILDL